MPANDVGNPDAGPSRRGPAQAFRQIAAMYLCASAYAPAIAVRILDSAQSYETASLARIQEVS